MYLKRLVDWQTVQTLSKLLLKKLFALDLHCFLVILKRHVLIFWINADVNFTDVNWFVLRFYGPVNPMGSCRARSVYLTTDLLGRFSPQSG